MLRPYNMATGAAPFESLQVADCGDVPINTFHLEKSVDIITEWYTERILSHGTIPLTMGGDHTIALPLLRAMAAKHGYGMVGLVHVDAHADVNEHMFGEQYAHGTPFRRAVEENLIGATTLSVCAANGDGRLIGASNAVQIVRGLFKSGCVGLATPRRISIGAVSKVSAWFKQKSVGTNHLYH